MPFVSKSQQKFMFANMPKMAIEWAHKTSNIKRLPEHVKKKILKKSIKKYIRK